MELTYESICEKLGFDPMVNPPERKYNGHEDDTEPSPYAVLTLEESNFLMPYMFEAAERRKRQAQNHLQGK